MNQSQWNDERSKLYKGQKSRLSIIPQSDWIELNIQPHINDILALEFSDTLINAAYHLSSMKIQLAIQKLCVLQRLFVENISWGFEGIMQWGNREYEISQQKHFQQQILQNREQILTVLTKQQQQLRVVQEVSEKLGRMVMILNNKNEKKMYHALCLLHMTHDNNIQQLIRKPTRTNKFQPITTKQQSYIRRSIEKDPLIRRTTHHCSFSLSKDYKSSIVFRNKATISNNQQITERKKYIGNISATKSTCSQSSCQVISQFNGNNYTTTQEKQLVTLRTKYNKLVQQFHQFSERFLSVIRQQ